MLVKVFYHEKRDGKWITASRNYSCWENAVDAADQYQEWAEEQTSWHRRDDNGRGSKDTIPHISFSVVVAP